MDSGPGDPNSIGPGSDVSIHGNTSATWLVSHADQYELLRTFGPATAIAEDHQVTTPANPDHFALYQNYPNPFNSGTVIHFALPKSMDVELTLYNLAGQQVASLVGGVREAGSYRIYWDGRDGGGHELVSGVYLYRLLAGSQVETRKLLLLR